MVRIVIYIIAFPAQNCLVALNNCSVTNKLWSRAAYPFESHVMLVFQAANFHRRPFLHASVFTQHILFAFQ